jgi:hypothetical protein
MIRKRCRDSHLVCEEHPDKPIGHDGCNGAGDPCPMCNPARAEEAPAPPPDFEVETEWLPDSVAIERSKNGVTPRTASFAGAPWSKQDDYDLRYLLEWEGQSEHEIARFLQREPQEIEERVKASTVHDVWRPLSSDDNVIHLVGRAGRIRWHK